jgi:hypothetical protein
MRERRKIASWVMGKDDITSGSRAHRALYTATNNRAIQVITEPKVSILFANKKTSLYTTHSSSQIQVHLTNGRHTNHPDPLDHIRTGRLGWHSSTITFRHPTPRITASFPFLTHDTLALQPRLSHLPYISRPLRIRLLIPRLLLPPSRKPHNINSRSACHQG